MTGTRKAEVKRSTLETKIDLLLNVDGKGEARLEGVPSFWKHMLEQWVRHGLFDLRVNAGGDVEIDHHHLMEDLGLTLGSALQRALGEKEGINRYGYSLLPMDDALVMAAVDLSGRAYLNFDLPLSGHKVGGTDAELAEEFWRAFVNEGRFNLHVKLMHGQNVHHIVESLFKAVGRAMSQAVARGGDSKEIPSTKGIL